MKKSLLFALALTSIKAFSQSGLPSNPEPGKCYVKCVTHDEFKNEDVQIEVSPEYKVITTKPATYKTVTDRVLVKEASKKMIYHPAEYTTTKISYIKKEEERVLSPRKADFGTDSKTIETLPKTANWEYTSYSECASPNPEDCQTLCYVETPAQYQTVPVKTLAKNATTVASSKPSQEATYNKQVISKAAYIEEVEIPAVYSTITRRVIDQPAKEEVKVIPAVYKSVTKQVLVKKGSIASWQEIDCELVQAQDLNIIWNTNSATLTSAARREIDRVLFPLLTNNPNVSIELSSHTDSRGSDAFNSSLSQRRADAVKSYLVSRGVSSRRLVSKGYGETRLKNNCSNGVSCTAAQHQVNRRTEYRAISK